MAYIKQIECQFISTWWNEKIGKAQWKFWAIVQAFEAFLFSIKKCHSLLPYSGSFISILPVALLVNIY